MAKPVTISRRRLKHLIERFRGSEVEPLLRFLHAELEKGQLTIKPEE